jgi:hypothetical protein
LTARAGGKDLERAQAAPRCGICDWRRAAHAGAGSIDGRLAGGSQCAKPGVAAAASR